MKKVLVGMDSRTENFWPFIYAVNLAKRVQMKLYVLLVMSPQKSSSESEKGPKGGSSFRKRLETLISDGRSMGISIEYYIANGSFKEELMGLIQDQKISLLVLGAPPAGTRGDLEKMDSLLEEIKFRTSCRIEVVHPRNPAQEEIRNG
ncbi:universal stress protein [Desulfatibacillum aliphaticivorans]|uniref:universal stress protein n=1 Tax=Desulfatibacillum aliphaticivorans TaxID=218208 RepID=UPI000484B23A|nr:universal stress protein [Desulfatibacillum aliphaticivorans]